MGGMKTWESMAREAAAMEKSSLRGLVADSSFSVA